MKTLFLMLLLSLGGTFAFASNVGDSYERVIAEKGKPLSRMDAGRITVLNYADVSIKCRDNVVVEISSIKDARLSVTHAVAPSKASPRIDAPDSDLAWTTDYQTALTSAKAERRNVFLFFTGSDWCGWCKKLDHEILSTPEFSGYAAEKLILVELDFPRHTEQSDDLKRQNQSLLSHFRISGYPTVIVLNPEGRIVAELGYQEGGPAPFIDKLKSVEP